MGGKVNVSFYNQYSSKIVLLGDIYLPPPLEGPSGLPLPPEVLGDTYPLTALVSTCIDYKIKHSLLLPYPPSKG